MEDQAWYSTGILDTSVTTERWEKAMKHVKKYAILFLMVFALALMTNTKAEAATVAKIGGRSYSSLKTAIRRVRNNQTIKLMRNVTLKKQLVISNNKKFTINLNRHTIRMSRGKKGGFMYGNSYKKQRTFCATKP